LTTLELLPTKLKDYPGLLNYCESLKDSDKICLFRNLCRIDIYFLIRYVLARPDIENEWIFERCREVQVSPDGHLDLWAREHYKSTIITYGKSIQDILASHGDEPLPEWKGKEVTIGIFSHTRPIAKGFLRQIMRELEGNKNLIDLFPDVLWHEPKRFAPKWSEDDGIIVKRKSNPKESTVEAWGIVDGQPTSKHFYIRVYDDVVTKESVRSPDMMAKTTESWEHSLDLGIRGGKERYIGTRYHYNDTYREMMDRNAAIVRLHPATKNGKVDGEPVLLTKAELMKKRETQGPYTFGCQQLQDPKADEVQGFLVEWLTYYQGQKDGSDMNVFILVDPANEKKKKSDYTSMWVLGAAADMNYYLLGGLWDRLSLTERTRKLFALHRDYMRPGKQIKVGYEKYGKDSDIEHIEDKMESENYRFIIIPLGGMMAKNDRIRRIIPEFEQKRIILPREMPYTTYENKTVDLIQIFIKNEYTPFPVAKHDDMLDNLSRLKDMPHEFPSPKMKAAPISIPDQVRF